jgi:hypothetical protein
MHTNRPDAVRSHLSYAGTGDSFARLSTLNAEFSHVLNVDHTFVRHQGIDHFISGNASDTLNFPGLSPRSGRPRYTWVDRGDGVLYGYLTFHDAID